MIDATELRIGNFVNYMNVVISIDAVGILDLVKNSSIGVEPVALSEEWLLKFGFERDGERKYFYLFVINRKVSLSFDINTMRGMLNNSDKEVLFQYIHQLQNLYFALTNEEMIVGETKSKPELNPFKQLIST